MATAPAAGAEAAKTRELVGLVQSEADLAVRARALQQLALVGTQEAVPVLSGLLADEKLGQYARDALEQMPEPAAGEALRNALGRLQGRALVGVVNSLGARRDAPAVGALQRIATDAASPAAGAALVALGRIGTPEALRVLEAALSRGPAELRAAAAEGCLLGADHLLREGQRSQARALYEAVRRADVAMAWRAAATRGAILLGGAEGLKLLLAQLRSAEPDLRDVALGAARELREPQVTPALIGEMDRLAPPHQAAVIAALVDIGDAHALAAIEARAGAGVETVRVAALQALGAMGCESSVPLLLRAMRPPSSPPVAEAALASLARIKVAGADATIGAELASADPATKVSLIGVLGDRKAESATAELMKLAAGADVEVAKAAFRALGLVTNPAGLPQLIRLAIAVQDDDVKALADRAIVTTAMKVLEPERRAEAVLQAFREAADPVNKAALLRPLGAIMRTMGGNHDVFCAVRAALKDPAEVVRAAALRCLAEWPEATPTMALLELAQQKGTAPAQRETALRGAVRMAGNVAAGRERSPLNVLGAFEQANRAAQTKEEKMLVVAGLGSVRRLEAVQMLRPYLDDAEVKAEAALAVVQVVATLPGPRNLAVLKPVLERIAADEKDPDVRRRAVQLAKGGAIAAAAKGKAGKATKAGAVVPSLAPVVPLAPGQLFNGRDLSHWDGDPGVWRVRDGVIVGGSLLGNPRNEFLATAKRYRNFVLRLEYRIIGTDPAANAGVQFRSERVKQPPNEMSGYQADIGQGYSGSLYDESRRRKFLVSAPAELIKRLEKPGDWNRYEIRCQGPRVELTLNGERTVSYTETEAGIAAEGLIALQIHGRCQAEIAYRALTIEEL